MNVDTKCLVDMLVFVHLFGSSIIQNYIVVGLFFVLVQAYSGSCLTIQYFPLLPEELVYHVHLHVLVTLLARKLTGWCTFVMTFREVYQGTKQLGNALCPPTMGTRLRPSMCHNTLYICMVYGTCCFYAFTTLLLPHHVLGTVSTILLT